MISIYVIYFGYVILFISNLIKSYVDLNVYITLNEILLISHKIMFIFVN